MTTWRQLWPNVIVGGGGGSGGPTVVYLDDIGVKDSDSWAWALGDQLGEQDSMSQGWSLGDEIGMQDADGWGWAVNPGDVVGEKDTMSQGWTLGDVVGEKDTMSQGWTLGDDEGLKDSAAITGTGTPQWQSVITNSLTAAGTTITMPSSPAGTVAGDTLFAVVSTANLTLIGVASINVPVGWTSATANVTLTGTTAALAQRVFWRVADGTSADHATVSFSASASEACYEIHRLTGCAASPVNASASATLLATSLTTNPVGPVVTSTVANCMVIQTLNHYHAALSNSHTVTAGYTERTDFQSTVATVDGQTSDTVVVGTAGASPACTHNCTETVATDAVLLAVAVAPGSISINL